MSYIRIMLIGLAMIPSVALAESSYITTQQQRDQAAANLKAHQAAPKQQPQQQPPAVSSDTVHSSSTTPTTPNMYDNETVNHDLGVPAQSNRSGGF
jgi:hypothetical protein